MDLIDHIKSIRNHWRNGRCPEMADVEALIKFVEDIPEAHQTVQPNPEYPPEFDKPLSLHEQQTSFLNYETLQVLADSYGYQYNSVCAMFRAYFYRTTLDMLLFCPQCGTLHVDAPEPPKMTDKAHFPYATYIREGWTELSLVTHGLMLPGWTNPPHKSHKCAKCKKVWRPADFCTNGVVEIKTQGKGDTWTIETAVPSLTSKVVTDYQNWQVFREAGLLWWINRQLHLFGWAISAVVEKDGSISSVRPIHCNWRGFPVEVETEGFKQLTLHLNEGLAQIMEPFNQ